MEFLKIKCSFELAHGDIRQILPEIIQYHFVQFLNHKIHTVAAMEDTGSGPLTETVSGDIDILLT